MCKGGRESYKTEVHFWFTMGKRKKDKITGSRLRGDWTADGGSFDINFDEFDVDGSYKYKSKVKNGMVKARIFDNGENIGFFKADYDVIREFSGGEGGMISLSTETGGIQLFHEGDKFGFGYIDDLSNYL
jgi:hypothetical protein